MTDLPFEFDDDASAGGDVGAGEWGLFTGDAAAERAEFELILLGEFDGGSDTLAKEVGDFDATLFDIENNRAARGLLVITRAWRGGS